MIKTKKYIYALIIALVLSALSAYYNTICIDDLLNKVVTCASIGASVSIALIMTRIQSISSLDKLYKETARQQILTRLSIIYLIYLIVIMCWLFEINMYVINVYILYMIKYVCWLAVYMTSWIIIDFYSEYLQMPEKEQK